jgi:hypothetical protein
MKKTRMKTQDVAFTFRMGAGFPGDVNRTHPASIEPCLIDASAPPTAFGQAVLVDATTQGVRPYASGDQSDTVASGYGITVRPYPFQQSSASNYGATAIGAGAPPVSGVIDVLRAGYIMANLAAGGSPNKGDPVYIWSKANSGAHVLGGFETSYSSTNTTKLLNATFNGTPDASGNVEIAFNI